MRWAGLRGWTRQSILEIFARAEAIEADPGAWSSSLRGRHVALLFDEPSTRTRASYELALGRLGARATALTGSNSSAKKGESCVEACRNLEAIGFDAVVVRTGERGAVYEAAERVSVPVLNAGDGAGEHPSQGLLDAITLWRRVGRRRADGLVGKRIAIVGDIAHSRVARSDRWALGALGAEIVIGAPEAMLPGPEDESWRDIERAGSRREALAGAAAVIALRIQLERAERAAGAVKAYARAWGIDEAAAEAELEPEAWVMHPGPVTRGVELSGEVADGPRSLIMEQVRAGVSIRQALLTMALGAKPGGGGRE